MSSPPSNAAENAAAAIVNACRRLQNGLGENPPLSCTNLLFEFKRDTRKALDEIENYGSEKYFASTAEWFIVAANSWNKYVYSRLREGIGEIRRTTGSDESNIKIVLYTWESPQ